MAKIYVEFNDEIDFNIDIYDDEVSNIFFQQQKKLNDSEKYLPEIDKFELYSIDYFHELIQKAKNLGIIDFTKYVISPKKEDFQTNENQFNEMHKTIEVMAKNLFSMVPEIHQPILNNIHNCLHYLEEKNLASDLSYKEFTKRNFLKTMYSKRDPSTYSMIPESVKFSRNILRGEVTITYCFTGREPIICAVTNDNSILSQTCKMVNRIGYNWILYLNDSSYTVAAKNNILSGKKIDQTLEKWYYENKEFADSVNYSLEKLINRTGYYPVGIVRNEDALSYISETKSINITKLETIR